jgi:hypothetical protein
MKQALFVVSGVAIGLLSVLVSLGCKSEVLPRAEAQAAAPADAQASGNVIMGIGGASPNQNDLCWVLVKAKGKQGDADRYSLSLYKADNRGVFDLTDVREITYDGKLVQLNHPSHNKDLTPPAIKKKLDQLENHREGDGNNPRPPNNP